MLSNMSTKTNTPSVPFVDQYLSALLNQAAQLITVDFHAVVKRRGLSLVEWRVLASLYEHDEVSIGQLAQLTLQKQPTLTRLLDRIERMGHIERFSNGGDRRITLVRNTALGRELVAGLIEDAKAHEARMLAPFGAERTEALKAALRSLIALYRG
ncbi:MarR family transcriptional regulator [soil metagenome]